MGKNTTRPEPEMPLIGRDKKTACQPQMNKEGIHGSKTELSASNKVGLPNTGEESKDGADIDRGNTTQKASYERKQRSTETIYLTYPAKH